MMHKHLGHCVAACFTAILLSSCASKGNLSAPEYEGSIRIENKLEKAAMIAANAQDELARVQIARTKPAAPLLDESTLPDELKRPATISWAGPAEDAARKISELVGYSFQITGNPPSVLPVIQADYRDVTAGMALYQIGVQVYPFGEIGVDTVNKRVEFRYLQGHAASSTEARPTKPQQPRRAEGSSPSWGK